MLGPGTSAGTSNRKRLEEKVAVSHYESVTHRFCRCVYSFLFHHDDDESTLRHMHVINSFFRIYPLMNFEVDCEITRYTTGPRSVASQVCYLLRSSTVGYGVTVNIAASHKIFE